MDNEIREQHNMVELTGSLPNNSLTNEDIAPTKIAERSWSRWDIAALWIGMAVCIPTYMLAASLLNEGMNWWQAILTVLIGNVVVLLPMILNAHPGTKYGIPFPVLTRASFGTKGAHIPSILRALVACGWFGIQTWIGGFAIYVCLIKFYPSIQSAEKLFIGINVWQLSCFLIFWACNMAIIVAGIESIRWLENYVAPILILMGLGLLGWSLATVGMQKALDNTQTFTQPAVVVSENFSSETITLSLYALESEGKSRVTQVVITENDRTTTVAYAKQITYKIQKLPQANEQVTLGIVFRNDQHQSKSIVKTLRYTPESSPSPPQKRDFWKIFFPLLTAIIGFWATLSLNIPDFTRYASSQKEHIAGQFIGLPLTMALYSFVGLIATSTGIILFSDILIAQDAPWDPVTLLSRVEQPWIVVVAMIFIAIATLSTNLAANVVAPANGFSNLYPQKISFTTGGLITGIIGIAICPWKLIESTQGYIFTWLIGYSALLGPIAGIVIADYFLVRKTRLNLAALYDENAEYSYTNGFNNVAIIALILGVIPNIPGFLAACGFVNSVPQIFMTIYTYAWFVGFFISLFVYIVLMPKAKGDG
ncbi:NCS1 family nucleobase:cation symporter-1 [Candidatus Uabimicrobium amorphum]|uniref:Nitrate reductase n=1 Tax=Uabimicrobium amorphum TaxID=2596890 RepID=A0A5S9F324_UABAM|nr:NCS1 family nucleobase:cation symporter-1 [Candidatus Uabimicrobium amorphum]BBM82722.1 nitrate reductase [Candidatus Uabimicrobium amorphum]